MSPPALWVRAYPPNVLLNEERTLRAAALLHYRQLRSGRIRVETWSVLEL